MLGMWQRIWGRGGEPSKKVAKERLHSVLTRDRAEASPFMEALKSDLVQTVSKYMDVDARRLEIQLRNSPEAVALVANIPVVRMKRVPGR
ncbi:MAG: cell division topological specificity factor MinE [Clostridia bacterium]|jgi:cell division topological specificity factor|nr:cell division topological specificity factor MinE [Clostridia bacterium]MDH7573592.1 cell division topological specificity factor MinE [Clostridia bacterium]